MSAHTPLFAAGVTAALFFSTVTAEATHPFGVDDLVRLQRLSEPALSPDERFLAFTLR